MSETRATEHRTAELKLASAARKADVHSATMSRWLLRGVRLSDGSILKLAGRRYPGGWRVTQDALDEFVDRLTADRNGQPAPVVPRSPSRRAHELARVDRELDAILG